MSRPTIHGNRKPVSASSILETLGADLLQIKSEDGLTFSDLGRVLGKSEDQAAKYCEGSAEMGVTAYYFAKQAWNGRFTGRADDAVMGAVPDKVSDRLKESRVLKAALALSVALEDGDISEGEIQANRATLEHAKDAISALLNRIGPKNMRA